MNSVDLSIAVILHSEGDILKSSFRNIFDMVEKLAAAQISYEILLNLDKADTRTTELTQAFAQNSHRLIAGKVRVFTNSFGDPSPSRNFLSAQAKGKYIAILDGDDIFSPSWLLDGYKLILQSHKEIILHSQFDLSFGDDKVKPVVWTMEDSRSLCEDWLILFGFNPWGTGIILKTKTALAFPYRANGSKYGFEDWAFNIESRYGGVEHRIIPNNTKFYRRRADSVFSEHKGKQRILYPVKAYQFSEVANMLKKIDFAEIWDIPQEWNVPRYNIPLRLIRKFKTWQTARKRKSITTEEKASDATTNGAADTDANSAKQKKMSQTERLQAKLEEFSPQLYEDFRYAHQLDTSVAYSPEQIENICSYNAMHKYIGGAYCEQLLERGLVKVKNIKTGKHQLNQADQAFVEQRIALYKELKAN